MHHAHCGVGGQVPSPPVGEAATHPCRAASLGLGTLILSDPNAAGRKSSFPARGSLEERRQESDEREKGDHGF